MGSTGEVKCLRSYAIAITVRAKLTRADEKTKKNNWGLWAVTLQFLVFVERLTDAGGMTKKTSYLCTELIQNAMNLRGIKKGHKGL